MLRSLLEFLCFHTRVQYVAYRKRFVGRRKGIHLRSVRDFQTLDAWRSRRKASKMTRANFPPSNGKQFLEQKAQDGRGSKEGEVGEETSGHKSLLNLERMESVVCSVIYQDSVADITAE